MPFLTSIPDCFRHFQIASYLSVRLSVALVFLITMTACGGGGGGGGKASSSTAATNSSASVSSSSLPAATDPFATLNAEIMTPLFKGLSDSRYSGVSATAEINEQNLAVFAQYLFQTSNDSLAGQRFKPGAGSAGNISNLKSESKTNSLPILAELSAMISASTQANAAHEPAPLDTTFDESTDCAISGTRTSRGVRRSDESHEILYIYTNCQNSDASVFNGRMASVRGVGWRSEKRFYDQYQVTRGLDKWLLNGYVDISHTDHENSYTYNLTLDDLSNSEQYQLVAFSEKHSFATGYVISFTGDIYVGSVGKLSIATPIAIMGNSMAVGSVSLIGSNNATGYINFQVHGIVVAIDTDNDGNLNIGVAVADTNQFENFVESSPVFVPVSELNFPPKISNFYWDSGWATTLMELRVMTPTYTDPEAQILSLTYEWYINGDLSNVSTAATFPAQIAKVGDSVKVYAVVSDGVNTTRKSSGDLVIQDSLGIAVIDMPINSVAPGETVKFKATSVDPDSPDISSVLKMLSAPQGATIDSNGNVEWVAVAPVIGQSMNYRFTFDSTGLNGNTNRPIEVFVTVTDESKLLPIARFGIQMGSERYSMWVGDYDGDGRNELLTTDGIDRVFTVSYNSGLYQQTWMYPLSLNTPKILRVLKANYDSDGADDIVVVGGRNINLIADLDKAATQIINLTNAYFNSAQVYDIDNNGSPELIAITTGDGSSSSPKLVVYALASGELLKSINLSSFPKELVIGNIDNDASPEIILANGYVYDTATWKNEWYYSSGFGPHLAIGDLDNNGVDEIVVGNEVYNGELKVFSGISKTVIASLPINSIQSVNVAGSLIVVGAHGSNRVATYSLSGSTLSQQQVLVSNNYQSQYGAAVGDTDGDGLVDFHLSMSSSLVVVGGNQVIWNEGGTEPHLLNFAAAGWIKPAPDKDEQAIFTASTNQGSQGQRLALMNDAGAYSLTEPLNSSHYNSGARYGVVLDFDNDGDGEIFTSNRGNSYPNQFVAYSLDDLSELADSRSDYSANSDVSLVEGHDINEDGYADALYAAGNLLTVRDIANNGVIISTDISTDEYIVDFALVKKTAEGAVDLVVATGNNLSVWRKEITANDSVTFVKKFSLQLACSRVLAREADGGIEVYCPQSGSHNLTRLAYAETDIAFTSNVVVGQVDGAVTDMAFSEKNPTQLYLGVAASSFYSDYMEKNYLGVFDLEHRETIGQIDIIGRIAMRSIHERRDSSPGQARVVLATSRAMYIFH